MFGWYGKIQELGCVNSAFIQTANIECLITGLPGHRGLSDGAAPQVAGRAENLLRRPHAATLLRARDPIQLKLLQP